MREAYHHVALLLLFQFLCYAVGCLNGVKVFHAHTLVLVHQSQHLRADAENADAQSVALQNHVRLDDALYGSARKVVVGAYHRELRHAEDACHVVQSVVELMVADGHGVILHHIHQSNLHIALVYRVERRSLREVAAVEEQQVWILLAFLIYHCHTSYEAAASSHESVLQVGIERQDAGVCVVGVEYFECLLRCSRQRGEAETRRHEYLSYCH